MNKKIIIVSILVAMIMIGSASNPERMGNPHVDDNTTIEVTVYPEVTVYHNSTNNIPDVNVTVECIKPSQDCGNITPLIVSGETVITKNLIEGFLCKNGFILFSEKAESRTELTQVWITPSGEFFSVGLYEDLNGHPTLRLYDYDSYETRLNEVIIY